MSDSLYKGCSIPARLPFIEAAAKYIIEKLGLDIEDMGERPCCMEPVGLRSLDHDSWSDISSYICSCSKGRLITLCDGCSVSLEGSVKENGLDTEIIGFLEVIHENIDAVKKSFTGLIGKGRIANAFRNAMKDDANHRHDGHKKVTTNKL